MTLILVRFITHSDFYYYSLMNYFTILPIHESHSYTRTGRTQDIFDDNHWTYSFFVGLITSRKHPENCNIPIFGRLCMLYNLHMPKHIFGGYKLLIVN
jgi:hypothetical protein